MKSSVSSILARRVTVTEVIAAHAEHYQVDSLNDLTARPIPAAEMRWGGGAPAQGSA